MPTDLELVTSFNSLSTDAKEVLQKLVNFVTTNGQVTWNLSGGVQVTVDSIPKINADFLATISTNLLGFYKDFGDTEQLTTTLNTNGTIATATVTFTSGWSVIYTYTYSSGTVTGWNYTIKNASGVTQYTNSRTVSYSPNLTIT